MTRSAWTARSAWCVLSAGMRPKMDRNNTAYICPEQSPFFSEDLSANCMLILNMIASNRNL